MCAYLKAWLGRPHKALFIINAQDFLTIYLVISVQNVLLILSMVKGYTTFWIYLMPLNFTENWQILCHIYFMTVKIQCINNSAHFSVTVHNPFPTKSIFILIFFFHWPGVCSERAGFQNNVFIK